MATASDHSRRDTKRFTDVNKEPDKMLQSLRKLPNKPVLPLRDAVKPIDKKIDDLSDQVTLSLNQCQHPKDGLTQDQSAALYLYSLQSSSGKHSFYEWFNRVLRHENRTKVVPYYDYWHLFVTSLEKLPSIKDHVWRGANGDLSDQYQPKSVHVWLGVSSCSDMVNVREMFLDETNDRTLFNIKCYEGKIIKNHSAFPNYNETVLPPGFCFRVKSVSNPTPKCHIIDVEQIPFEEPAQETVSPSTALVAAHSVCLIWLDPSVNKSKHNIDTQQQLQQLQSIFQTFENLEQCETFIQQNKEKNRLVLIVGGQIGQQIVPNIHNLSHVVAIYVYCMNKDANEEWARNYTKIKAVIIQSKELIGHVEKEIVKLIGEVKSKSSDAQDTSRDLVTGKSSCTAIPQLDGLQYTSLLSLEEAVKPLVNLIPNIQHYVNIAKSNSKNPADGLTCDESASIYLYTMKFESTDRSVNAILNENLRSENRNAMKPWFFYVKLIFTALHKLPPFKGTVWRGLRADLSHQYSAGSTHVWWTFSTAAISKEILNTEQFLGKTGTRTLFSIDCKNSRNIRKHANSDSGIEVLLMPGFNFVVEGVLNTGNSLFLMNIKEI